MSRSTYYKVCPDCGVNLDPGESCDCKRESDMYNPIITSATGISETYLVGVDILTNGDKPGFMVSKVCNGKSVEVMTCLFGQEALDAYAKFSALLGEGKLD